MGPRKSDVLLSCFLGLIFFVSLSTVRGAPNFMALTLVWPGSYCIKDNGWSKGCCTPTAGNPALDFFVERMERYYSPGSVTSNSGVSACRFFLNPLSDIIDDMISYWPDLRCPSSDNKEEWQYIWCNYASTTDLSNSEAAYFGSALQLRVQVNPLSLLSSAGIVPSKTKLYQLADIEKALSAKVGPGATTVQCYYSSGSSGAQLSGLRVCVSLDGKSVISCPVPSVSNCPKQLTFPPFTSDMLMSKDDALLQALIQSPSSSDDDKVTSSAM